LQGIVRNEREGTGGVRHPDSFRFCLGRGGPLPCLLRRAIDKVDEKLRGRDVLNIAHRGASAYRAENTMEAFVEAITLGGGYDRDGRSKDPRWSSRASPR
ncbi:MAG: hypothetical protein KAJ09_09320, partial [Deltaproteobacteria bacterium]|nr:hypothetical protein [Deltaproteobacteria bacterium]